MYSVVDDNNSNGNQPPHKNKESKTMKKTINNVYDFQDLDATIREIVEGSTQPVAFKVLANDWQGEPVEVVFYAKIHEETGWVGYNETVKSTRRNAYRPDILYFCDIVSEYGYGFTVVKA